MLMLHAAMQVVCVLHPRSVALLACAWCMLTLAASGCGAKQEAQPHGAGGTMEGGGAGTGAGSTTGTGTDHGTGNEDVPVEVGEGEPGTQPEPEPIASVVGGKGFPEGVVDDPSTPHDDRMIYLPYNDDRVIAKKFEQQKEYRDAEGEEAQRDAEGLPYSLGGLTHDAHFFGAGDEEDSDAPAIEPTEMGRRVRVWYGTNRAGIDPSDPSKGFANAREPDAGKLHVGSVICDVPNSRPVGTTGSGYVARLLKGEDDRIKIERLFVEDEELMIRQIARRLQLAPPDERCIVVYIHGYKNSFESAALRTAQLAVDLNVPGLTAFYSWPSMDLISEYIADEAAVETAEKHLHHFLTRMARDTNASKVHLIAHSLGNRVLARVMQRLASSSDTKELKFGQIILAAPDIDMQVFYDLAQTYPKLSDRTTLYVSQKDKALEASAWTHSYHRAGYAPPVAVLPPIDTVEVTNIDVSILGHGYVAEAEHVLFDIAMMLRKDTAPLARPRMVPETTEEGKAFWVLKER